MQATMSQNASKSARSCQIIPDGAGEALGSADPRDDAEFRQVLRERHTVLGFLTDRLIIKNDAGDVVAHRLIRAEQHLAIITAVAFGRFHADGVKALLDGA